MLFSIFQLTYIGGFEKLRPRIWLYMNLIVIGYKFEDCETINITIER